MWNSGSLTSRKWVSFYSKVVIINIFIYMIFSLLNLAYSFQWETNLMKSATPVPVKKVYCTQMLLKKAWLTALIYGLFMPVTVISGTAAQSRQLISCVVRQPQCMGGLKNFEAGCGQRQQLNYCWLFFYRAERPKQCAFRCWKLL